MLKDKTAKTMTRELSQIIFLVAIFLMFVACKITFDSYTMAHEKTDFQLGGTTISSQSGETEDRP